MAKIYIGLSTKKGFYLGSELIKWGENTEYSHVYIRRESAKVGEYIYQATAAGSVNFMGIEIFKSQNKIIEEYEFDIPDESVSELVRFFIQNAGREYSKKQILLLIKVIGARKLGIKYKPKKENIDSSGWICSELGAIVLRNFVGDSDLPDSLDLVTPKGLRPHLIEHGKRVI